ncbi:MAG: PSP1 domain-containing protein, partial [Vicinamibacterales bacterium]
MSSGPARPFVSVRFSPAGRTYSFLLPEFALDAAEDPPPAIPFVPGDRVVVETAEGPAIGTVARTIPPLAARRSPPDDSPARVVRRATRDDVVARLKHQQREQEARQVCLARIRERGLAMKLTRVEQLFDGSRLIFYYTAEGRVDFRELVRDLAAHFRTRIEMRQIGVRDEARMLGGYGPCGRPLCCTTWLQT